MYDLLTTRELTVLQSMLYEGAEDTFAMAYPKGGDDPDDSGNYRPLYQEIAHLFIEAGTDLVERLRPSAGAA